MMNRIELVEMIDEALNDVLVQYLTRIDSCGDVTPEETLEWDEMVESIASAFERLGERGKLNHGKI